MSTKNPRFARHPGGASEPGRSHESARYVPKSSTFTSCSPNASSVALGCNPPRPPPPQRRRGRSPCAYLRRRYPKSRSCNNADNQRPPGRLRCNAISFSGTQCRRFCESALRNDQLVGKSGAATKPRSCSKLRSFCPCHSCSLVEAFSSFWKLPAGPPSSPPASFLSAPPECLPESIFAVSWERGGFRASPLCGKEGTAPPRCSPAPSFLISFSLVSEEALCLPAPGVKAWVPGSRGPRLRRLSWERKRFRLCSCHPSVAPSGDVTLTDAPTYDGYAPAFD